MDKYSSKVGICCAEQFGKKSVSLTKDDATDVKGAIIGHLDKTGI